METQNEKQKILVLGSSGKTGSRVYEKLELMGYPLKQGSRSAHPKFDWYDPSTWAEVLKDVQYVYITFQPDLAAPQAIDIITSFVKHAREAGAEKLVLLSGRGEEAAQQCEDAIINSGLRWNIVRASWFCQNFSEGFFLDYIRVNKVSLPLGDALEPFIDADDIADVVVGTLTDQVAENELFEVTGPRLLSFREAVAEIAAASGREIEYEQIPMDQSVQQLQKYQVPQEYIDLLSYLFAGVLDGHNAYLSSGVEKALGIKPRDFSQFVRDTARTEIWKANS